MNSLLLLWQRRLVKGLSRKASPCREQYVRGKSQWRSLFNDSRHCAFIQRPNLHMLRSVRGLTFSTDIPPRRVTSTSLLTQQAKTRSKVIFFHFPSEPAAHQTIRVIGAEEWISVASMRDCIQYCGMMLQQPKNYI